MLKCVDKVYTGNTMIGINKSMKTFLPTYLYVKTHNKTGLKYFGKTTNDPYNYRGSGTYWLAHLKIHGNDISTEVIGYYTNKAECICAAMEFSIRNNIVESVDDNNKKIWANQVLENGIDGGATRFGNHSAETKQKISAAQVGKTVSEETKQKLRNARAVQQNVRKKGEWNFPDSGKQKLREANLGKKQSQETIEKRRAKLIGHTVSDETRKKISAAQVGKTVSEETKQKLRNRIVSEETKQKIREKRKEQIFTNETKEKLKGKVVVIDKNGNLSKMNKEQYYSQTGPKEDWEWVSHKSKEAKMRRG